MKSDNSNIKEAVIYYKGTNNFICGTNGNRQKIAIDMLKKLDSENKKVIITDSYLFSSREPDYAKDLEEIMKSLKASEIVFCGPQITNQTLFQSIKTILNGLKCQLIHNNVLGDCHDRFWYCEQSDKAVVFGTSLNGLCKRICRIDELKTEEVIELKAELKSRGII